MYGCGFLKLKRYLANDETTQAAFDSAIDCLVSKPKQIMQTGMTAPPPPSPARLLVNKTKIIMK